MVLDPILVAPLTFTSAFLLKLLQLSKMCEKDSLVHMSYIITSLFVSNR